MLKSMNAAEVRKKSESAAASETEPTSAEDVEGADVISHGLTVDASQEKSLSHASNYKLTTEVSTLYLLMVHRPPKSISRTWYSIFQSVLQWFFLFIHFTIICVYYTFFTNISYLKTSFYNIFFSTFRIVFYLHPCRKSSRKLSSFSWPALRPLLQPSLSWPTLSRWIKPSRTNYVRASMMWCRTMSSQTTKTSRRCSTWTSASTNHSACTRRCHGPSANVTKIGSIRDWKLKRAPWLAYRFMPSSVTRNSGRILKFTTRSGTSKLSIASMTLFDSEKSQILGKVTMFQILKCINYDIMVSNENLSL